MSSLIGTERSQFNPTEMFVTDNELMGEIQVTQELLAQNSKRRSFLANLRMF